MDRIFEQYHSQAILDLHLSNSLLYCQAHSGNHLRSCDQILLYQCVLVYLMHNGIDTATLLVIACKQSHFPRSTPCSILLLRKP